MEDSLYRVPIKGLIQDHEGRVLVIATDRGGWQLPGGGMDHGEEPVQALRRELLEELGAEADTIEERPYAAVTFQATHGSRTGQWRIWVVYKVEMDIDKIILGDDVDAIDWAMVKLSELGESEVHPIVRVLFVML